MPDLYEDITFFHGYGTVLPSTKENKDILHKEFDDQHWKSVCEIDHLFLTLIELGDRILIGRHWAKGETIEEEVRGTNAVDLELKRIFGPDVKIRMLYVYCDYKNNKMILR